MTRLVDKEGKVLLNKDEQSIAEKQAGIVQEVMTVLGQREATLDDLLSVGINLILKGYQQVPPDDERSFIDVTMGNLAQAFGQITVSKRELVREARRAVESMGPLN